MTTANGAILPGWARVVIATAATSAIGWDLERAVVSFLLIAAIESLRIRPNLLRGVVSVVGPAPYLIALVYGWTCGGAEPLCQLFGAPAAVLVTGSLLAIFTRRGAPITIVCICSLLLFVFAAYGYITAEGFLFSYLSKPSFQLIWEGGGMSFAIVLAVEVTACGSHLGEHLIRKLESQDRLGTGPRESEPLN